MTRIHRKARAYRSQALCALRSERQAVHAVCPRTPLLWSLPVSDAVQSGLCFGSADLLGRV